MKWLALVVVAAMTIATAHADSSSKAQADATAAYQEGQRRYLAEDYLRAAEQFEAAYDLDPDPAYLFNIAQAYRFGKQCTKSIESYQRFLAVVAKPPNAEAVAGYIREQEACAKAEAAPVIVQPPLVVTPAPEPDPIVPVAPVHPSRTRTYVAVGMLAGGAVLAGAATYFAIDAERAESDREALCKQCVWDDEHTKEERRLDARGRRDQIFWATGYSLAGVAVATGVYLIVTGGSREHRVTVAPARRGAVLSVRF
jgi:tetratricopeptide (TPR) repeat protein